MLREPLFSISASERLGRNCNKQGIESRDHIYASEFSESSFNVNFLQTALLFGEDRKCGRE
jgi:hypothetical protein